MLKKTKLAAALLMAALAATGCGNTAQAGSAQGTPAPTKAAVSIKEKVQGAKQESTPTPEPAGQAAGTATPTEQVAGTPTPKPTSTPTPTPTEAPTPTPKPTAAPAPALDDVGAIAALAGLVGDQSLECMYTYNVVDVGSGENPYDLTWHYGAIKYKGSVQTVQREGWGDLWQSYVDACDWGLVFDINYYEETFPILAELYGHDAGLLLAHYQTVGVHEGRQASGGFCPAAYMENCSGELKAAFGDSPECYVIYYMLHHASEKNVDATNTDGKYPKWLSVELSNVQQTEFGDITKYRAEVNVDPIGIHPELVALACLRARIDAIGGYDAHDYVNTDNGRNEAYRWLGLLGLKSYSENTQKLDVNVAKTTYINNINIGYRRSEKHYAAMIDGLNLYVGCANIYYCGATARSVHFDCFAEALPNPGGSH